MAKRGRPGIPYEQFVEAWEQLVSTGRESTNAALDIIGGNKSTIIAFRERYEREKTSKEISMINSIELTEAVHKAIASVKVKEVDALERANTALKARIDEYSAVLSATERKSAEIVVDFEDAKTNFDIEKSKAEKQLAALQARIDDAKQRESALMVRYEQLNEQYNQARQDAAVAKKEVELLRESIGK